MDTVYDDRALTRRLIEIQAEDPALADATKEAGLDLAALLALYRHELRAGLLFTPEDLIRFAIKQHQSRPTSPPPAA